MSSALQQVELGRPFPAIPDTVLWVLKEWSKTEKDHVDCVCPVKDADGVKCGAREPVHVQSLKRGVSRCCRKCSDRLRREKNAQDREKKEKEDGLYTDVRAADEYLKCPLDTFVILVKVGAIEKKTENWRLAGDNRRVQYYHRDNLKPVKHCLQTLKQLVEKGEAESLSEDGLIWLIVAKGSNGESPRPVGHGKDVWVDVAKVYSINGAAQALGIPPSKVWAAIKRGEREDEQRKGKLMPAARNGKPRRFGRTDVLKAIKIYGPLNYAITEHELALFRKNNKPKKASPEYAIVSELYTMAYPGMPIEEITETQKKEVREQAPLFAKYMGLKTELSFRAGQGPIQAYHATKFVSLFNASLDVETNELRERVKKRPLVQDLKNEFKKKAIGDKRFDRIRRNAGAIVEPSPKRGELKRYVPGPHTITPIMKRCSLKEGVAFLRKMFAADKRALFIPDARKRAAKKGITFKVLSKAAKLIGCDVRYYPITPAAKRRPPRNGAFWFIPPAEYCGSAPAHPGSRPATPPTPEEVKQIFADYLSKNKKSNASLTSSTASNGNADMSPPAVAVPSTPEPTSAATEASGPGRPSGITADVENRMREMVKEWDEGKHKSKAAAGRAHGFHRPDASKIINDHMKAKA